VFTPFHKPPYPYLYGRSVDETTTPEAKKLRVQSSDPKEAAVEEENTSTT
jgi:hypothetical protein